MRPDLADALLMIGLGLLGYGCWLVYPPAGFIAVGAVLVGLVLWSHARR